MPCISTNKNVGFLGRLKDLELLRRAKTSEELLKNTEKERRVQDLRRSLCKGWADAGGQRRSPLGGQEQDLWEQRSPILSFNLLANLSRCRVKIFRQCSMRSKLHFCILYGSNYPFSLKRKMKRKRRPLFGEWFVTKFDSSGENSTDGLFASGLWFRALHDSPVKVNQHLTAFWVHSHNNSHVNNILQTSGGKWS